MRLDSVTSTVRFNSYSTFSDPLSAHLFNVDNPKWKSLRMKMTPTFTSGKMKMMFGTVVDVAEKLVKTLGAESSANLNHVIEIKDIAARFTTDVIGSCAFGLDCSSLEDAENEFRGKGRRLFDDPKHSQLVIQLMTTFKSFARKLHMTTLHKDSTDYFMGIIDETVKYREANDVRRNDFIHLMMQLKNNGTLDGDTTNIGKLTIEEVAAQSLIFFLAG